MSPFVGRANKVNQFSPKLSSKDSSSITTPFETSSMQDCDMSLGGITRLSNFFKKCWNSSWAANTLRLNEAQAPGPGQSRRSWHFRSDSVALSSFSGSLRERYNNLCIGLKFSQSVKYSVPELAECHVEWLQRTYVENPDYESGEVRRLKAMIRAWTPNLNAKDLRTSISETLMVCLLKQINKVFFAGAIPLHHSSNNRVFAWLDDDDIRLGLCSSYGYQPIIHIHPWRVDRRMSSQYSWDANVKMRDRLGSLLHELCHAVFIVYGDRFCSTWITDLGCGGHGPPWYVLATKIEEVAVQLLGMKLELGIGQSLAHDALDSFPSLENLVFDDSDSVTQLSDSYPDVDLAMGFSDLD
ncbi:hypothetical protein BKA66DRAFT_473168 [Pyrenochaeta sp. MPI-SDFR-AT-0127]|nr:hypothetical protein BKA66DRAFT_473168 [Pyrenochaeta sp. MPI-SDFR-AT-0127]